MKIRNIEKLQDLIDKDLSWRKKELIDIKLLIHSNLNPMLCRVGLALLSAHFEGFIKQAANYYVVYVSSQNIELSNLTTNFSSIHFSKEFENIFKSKKVSVQQKFINDFINDYYDKKFKVRYAPDKPIIMTDGSPTSVKLKEIIASIGLDFAPYETKSNYIDSDLLKNRNSIVHGEKIDIEINDFDDTFQNILNIIDIFNNQIINAAISKVYYKNVEVSENTDFC